MVRITLISYSDETPSEAVASLDRSLQVNEGQSFTYEVVNIGPLGIPVGERKLITIQRTGGVYA